MELQHDPSTTLSAVAVPTMRSGTQHHGNGAKACKQARVRTKPPLREARVELVGCLGDPVFVRVARILREVKNRYSPLVRNFITAVSPSQDEHAILSEHFVSPVAAFSIDRNAVCDTLTSCDGYSGELSLRSFLNERLLSGCLHRTLQQACGVEDHSLTAFSPQGMRCWPLFVKHFVHESSRTCSFIVGNTSTRRFAVLDPSIVMVEEYVTTVALLQASELCVCVTHAFLDIYGGVGELVALVRERIGDCIVRLVWLGGGLLDSSGPTGEIDKDVRLAMDFGGGFTLKAFSTPSVVVEHVMYELWCDNPEAYLPNSTANGADMGSRVLLAIFSGAALSIDAFARVDLFDLTPSPFSGLPSLPSLLEDALPATSPPLGQNGEAIMSHTLWRHYHTLQRVFARYFDGTLANRPAHDAAILFPSYGGYNNVTQQLDLYWAAHVGDLKRYAHTRKLYDMLSANREKDFVVYCDKLPPLPVGGLFASNRLQNVSALSKPLQVVPPLLESRSQREGVVLVDVRGFSDYCLEHVAGSVNVPMTFSGSDYGAKKAELWLSCLMSPSRGLVVVLCKQEDNKAEVVRRLRLIGVGGEAIVLSEEDWRQKRYSSQLIADLFSNSVRQSSTSESVVGEAQEGLPPEADNGVSFQRRASYTSLSDLELQPQSTTIVVDCRTLNEFRNGSHRSSVHVPLAEICAMFASVVGVYPSNLAREIIVRIHRSAVSSGIDVCHSARDVRKVIFYCAAGYRSHIASSIFRAAVEQRSNDLNQRSPLVVEISDVVGGALQIMTHRPDLWLVKDRSIICIS